MLGCTEEEAKVVTNSIVNIKPKESSQVGYRQNGSNYIHQKVETGFNANGHAQSWDGRLFIGSTGYQGQVHWMTRVFRPENLKRTFSRRRRNMSASTAP